MRLAGSIQDRHLYILVDSGSSRTFLSEALASHLQDVQCLPTPIRVQVANGAILHCTSYMPSTIHDFSFTFDIKVIPLDHYELILGMDWLEQHSPIKVHWKQKWISIPYKGSTAILHGFSPSHVDTLMVQVCSIAAQLDICKPDQS